MDYRRLLCLSVAILLVAGIASSAWVLDIKGNGPLVRGRVLSDGAPLAGVIVSNGRQLVRTDAEGRYSLPAGPDAGRFVFVCCPRGHWTDEFYRPIDEAVRRGKADFALRPVDQPDRFDFVFAADVHVEHADDKAIRDKLRATFKEIGDRRPKPAFLWIQGDLGIYDGGKRFLKCLRSVTIPVRMGIGNHEIFPSERNPKARYERLFGPTYYSFDWGPVHFIVLDGNKPAAHIRGCSLGTVEPREWAWLESDLAAQPADKPIVVGVHIPIVSTYPARRVDLKEAEAPFWQSPNGTKLSALLAKHRVRLVLQGHNHENERITDRGVEYVETVSLCGNWWKSGPGFERATDGSPRGYRVVSVDGNRIWHRYESSCESRVDRQGEFVRLRDIVQRCDDTPFVFNCYDAPNGSTACVRLDGGPWRAMNPVILEDSKREKPHHWRSSVDTRGLATGPHRIEARVTWPDGTVVRETASFRVKDRSDEDPHCAKP